MKWITGMAVVVLAAGCARFSTVQTETRNDAETKIVTKAAAYTLFDSKSALSQFEAKQSSATQSASVGSLSQETSGTNGPAMLQALAELLKALPR